MRSLTMLVTFAAALCGTAYAQPDPSVPNCDKIIPGMLMAASDLLDRGAGREVLDVDRGVLVFPDDIYYSKDHVDVIVP